VQVVEQRSERHERRDEHHLSRHTDGHDADAARMRHRRHDASLLQQLRVGPGIRPLAQLLYRHQDLDVLAFWDVDALQQLNPVYTIQPAVKPAEQQVVSCIQTFNWFNNRLFNR